MIIFPTLEGQTLNTIRYPIWSTVIKQNFSGREVRISYQDRPMWRWDLEFATLRAGSRNGQLYEELEQLMGFYSHQGGPNSSFAYQDPDSFEVQVQPFATVRQTSGTTQWYYPLSYSLGPYGGSEPIGYLDTRFAFTLYRNGIPVNPQDPNLGYQLQLTNPGFQYVVFTSPSYQSYYNPGDTLSWSGQYLYLVRFKDSQVEFEKFMNKLWLTKTISLVSTKPWSPTTYPVRP